ncbi:hypothetical protein Z517_09831 [Fonsecaea pedrosoi CBS 271.37]|uniref:Uncharacterized protein n=1 Tax=Fonsecaea pedrosoi CBS 271.37 TaxID=1442368 RepID=A0A0D2GFI5_9EURO|nr:uncharacterized protein Z517_09831 [Fonsecaea pedrosoi CBS 271.37]KIW77385.1 hypothetical protein Z517_09831 [Fonsecaea pedrosoi CBS 271.37]
MSTTPIRLRDSPAQVQEKLGLSNRQFDNFKNFARRVHGEYCAAHPNSKWADVNAVWTAVPEREKLDVIRLMYNLCTESNLFPPTTARAVIEAGIEQRLHQVRLHWLDGTPYMPDTFEQSQHPVHVLLVCDGLPALAEILFQTRNHKLFGAANRNATKMCPTEKVSGGAGKAVGGEPSISQRRRVS